MDGNQDISSVLGWVDFTEEDQKRAQDYLRSLSEGTLDELGFGIIRDAFADLFFPESLKGTQLAESLKRKA